MIQRAYATIEGRQVQLGPANSPESRAAFERVLREWYWSGRKLPKDASMAKDAQREKSAKRSAWRKLHGWHPHQARHSAATDLRKAGNLDVAKVVLGHTSITMTEQDAEADVVAALEVAERIG